MALSVMVFSGSGKIVKVACLWGAELLIVVMYLV